MMIGIMPFVFVLVVLLVCGLVSAASSGRVWSVLAGLIGMVFVVGAGLLLAGALYLASGRPAMVQYADAPKEVVLDEREPAPPLYAEAPELFPASDDNTSSVGGEGQIAERIERSGVNSDDQQRPAWMDSRRGLVGDVYRTTVDVGPWLTRTECEQQLPAALREAVRTYADRLLGEGKGQYVNLDMAYIHNQIVRGEWEEHREQTIDTMVYLHELLEFDREANQAIETSYKQAVVAGRLGYTAAGGGAVLGLLAILFGYFKLDTLTRGYYTGRLRLTAATAILAIAAIAGLLALA